MNESRKLTRMVISMAMTVALAFTGAVGIVGVEAMAPADSNIVAIASAKAKTKKVYIAPYSGKKYHNHKDCRGLRKARSKKRITLTKARKLGYKKCKICYG